MFRIVGYCSFCSGFCSENIGRFSSTGAKPVALVYSMTSDSNVEMKHFRSTRAKLVTILSSIINEYQVGIIQFKSSQAKPVSLHFSMTSKSLVALRHFRSIRANPEI
jgi:hypothetical protein